MLKGHVTWLYAFDIAHDMRREPLKTVLGRAVEPWLQKLDHRVPKQTFFHRPCVVRLPSLQASVPGREGQATLSRTLKILPVGGISIAITAEVRAESLMELVAWHDPPPEASTEAVRKLVDLLIADLRGHLIQPVDAAEEAEAYTIFRLDPVGGEDASDWLERNRREVAGLLTQERDARLLCEEEIAETVSKSLGYYREDRVVVDWDAALVIDREEPAAEVLHVLELANLQLCELEAYDRILDKVMEQSYSHIGQGRRYHTRILGKLGELRIDLSRLSDELTHAGKFLGDWHLARVYEAVSSRFHLADWKRVVDDKLKTLDELYQMLKHEQFDRWLLILELVVIGILVAEAALVVVPMFKR